MFSWWTDDTNRASGRNTRSLNPRNNPTKALESVRMSQGYAGGHDGDNSFGDQHEEATRLEVVCERLERRDTKLMRIRLEQGALWDTGMLCNALRKVPLSQKFHLRELILPNNPQALDSSLLAAALSHSTGSSGGGGHLEVVDLSGNKISSDGVAVLAASLYYHTTSTLRILNLSHNQIASESAIAEYVVRPSKSRVSDLDLSHNRLPRADELLGSLQTNQSLRIFNLAHNAILGIDCHAHEIAESFKNNKTLVELNLEHNEMGILGAVGLAHALGMAHQHHAAHSNNTEASAGQDQDTTSTQLVSLQTPPSSALKSPRRLKLGGNRFNTLGTRAMARALCGASPPLLYLDLRENEMTARSTMDFCRLVLHANCGLQELGLAKNEVGVLGAKALGEGLRLMSRTKATAETTERGAHSHNDKEDDTETPAKLASIQAPSSAAPNKGLTFLDVRMTSMGPSGMIELCKALPHCQTLTRLLLSTNHIGNTGAKALAQVLPATQLTYLGIQDNDISSDGIIELANTLVTYPTTLKCLMLEANVLIGDLGIQALVEVLCNVDQPTAPPPSSSNRDSTPPPPRKTSASVLATLDLKYCRLKPSHVDLICKQGLAANKSLKALHLDGNGALGNGAARVLAETLHRGRNRLHLTVVTLRQCGLTDRNLQTQIETECRRIQRATAAPSMQPRRRERLEGTARPSFAEEDEGEVFSKPRQDQLTSTMAQTVAYATGSTTAAEVSVTTENESFVTKVLKFLDKNDRTNIHDWKDEDANNCNAHTTLLQLMKAVSSPHDVWLYYTMTMTFCRLNCLGADDAKDYIRECLLQLVEFRGGKNGKSEYNRAEHVLELVLKKAADDGIAIRVDATTAKHHAPPREDLDEESSALPALSDALVALDKEWKNLLKQQQAGTAGNDAKMDKAVVAQLRAQLENELFRYSLGLGFLRVVLAAVGQCSSKLERSIVTQVIDFSDATHLQWSVHNFLVDAKDDDNGMAAERLSLDRFQKALAQTASQKDGSCFLGNHTADKEHPLILVASAASVIFGEDATVNPPLVDIAQASPSASSMWTKSKRERTKKQIPATPEVSYDEHLDTDEEEHCPIHAAVKYGNREVLQDELEEGKVPINRLDSKGRSAADLAAIRGEGEMLEMIEAHGGCFRIGSRARMRSLINKKKKPPL